MLHLTEAAVARVKKIAETQGLAGHHLRIMVVGGGCSGFSYDLDFEKEPEPEDSILDFDGVSVLVDPESAKYVRGVEVDFVETLTSAGFKFKNPNATATCGCGTSFTCDQVPGASG